VRQLVRCFGRAIGRALARPLRSFAWSRSPSSSPPARRRASGRRTELPRRRRVSGSRGSTSYRPSSSSSGYTSSGGYRSSTGYTTYDTGSSGGGSSSYCGGSCSPAPAFAADPVHAHRLLRVRVRRRGRNRDWDSGPPVDSATGVHTLTDLQRIDPEFSQVVFETSCTACSPPRSAPGNRAEALAASRRTSARTRARRSPPGRPPAWAFEQGHRRRDAHVPRRDPRRSARRTVRGPTGCGSASNSKPTSRPPATPTTPSSGGVRPRRHRAQQAARPRPHLLVPQLRRAVGGQPHLHAGVQLVRRDVDNGRFDWLVEDIQLVSSASTRRP